MVKFVDKITRPLNKLSSNHYPNFAGNQYEKQVGGPSYWGKKIQLDKATVQFNIQNNTLKIPIIPMRGLSHQSFFFQRIYEICFKTKVKKWSTKEGNVANIKRSILETTRNFNQ